MKYSLLLLWIFIGLLSVHCSNEKKKEPIVQRYFTNGDPKAFVAGTVMNTNLTLAELESVNSFSLNMLYIFEEKSEVKSHNEYIADQAGTESGESEVEDSSSSGLFVFSELIEDGVKKYSYKSIQQELELIFVEKNGNLKVEKLNLNYGTEFVDQNIQHLSISKDKKSFSVLLYLEEDRDLAAFYFTQPFTAIVNKVENGKYDYLAGRNVKVTWPKNEKTTLSICHPMLVKKVNQIRGSFKAWTEEIKSSSFELSILNNPPPFSDLNTHCLYIVDDYLTKAGNYINPASTLPYLKNDIVDSDIFLFEKEQNKAEESTFKELFSDRQWESVTHEIGHFLGLGHPSNLVNPEFPSIMSYMDNKQNKIYPHDIESITELYK